MDAVGIERSDRHDFLDLGHAYLARSRHRLIEIARGLAEDQVAAFIRLPALDDREIGADAAFEDIVLAVEVFHFLALGNQRADAGLGVETGNASAARAAALRQGPLRAELDLQFAGQILPLEFLILADIRTDHLLDLAGAQQLAEALAIDPGIVARNCQVFGSGIADRVDQALGDAAQPKAARANRHPVMEQPFESGGGVGIEFAHRGSLSDVAAD